MPDTKLIYGMHEKCPIGVLPDGWVLYIAEVGDSFDPHSGIDLSDESRSVMIRIQWRFGSSGACYPPPERQDGFIQRVASLAKNTPDCHTWIGGNEPNIATEGLFYPTVAAQNYTAIRQAIRVQVGHENDCVLLPPVGPWNAQIGYGWIEYFTLLIASCPDIDGFALHTYSRGADPASITSQAKMDPPYDHLRKGFRTYLDWMWAIPPRCRDLPVYITETDQNDAWENVNNGWVQAAYEEINTWNSLQGTQKIRAMLLYRWPHYDKYGISGLSGVIEDFKQAVSRGYTSAPTEEEEPVPNPENKVRNPKFEGTYGPQDGHNTVQVAPEHHAYWHQGRSHEAMPEYCVARTSRGEPDWEGAQQFFVESKLMDAGICQEFHVGEDAIGKIALLEVELGCEGHDQSKELLSNIFITIGIGRRGGWDDRARSVQWLSPVFQTEISNFHTKFGTLKTWTWLKIRAPIETEKISYFVHAKDEYRFDTCIFVRTVRCTILDATEEPEEPEVPVGSPIPDSSQFAEAFELLAGTASEAARIFSRKG